MKITKNIAILFGIIWILIVTMWVAFSVLIVLKTDDIGKYLILQINQFQSGELSVENVSISPLIQFPHISVMLKNVTYYEHKGTERSKSEQPIAIIDNFYCGFKILNLFKGDFKVSQLNVVGGELDLVIYPDSSVNLMNALKPDSSYYQKKTAQSQKTDQLNKTKPTTSSKSLIIEQLNLNYLRLKIRNDPDNKESSILIKNFDSEIDLAKNQANLIFTTSILVEKFKVNEDTYIKDQQIKLYVSSILNKENGLQVKQGKLNIAEATFDFNGYFNPSNGGDLSLKIVSDGSLDIFSLVLKEKIAKNLNKGRFYLFGFVEGKTFLEFPLINIDFGFEDVEFVNPVTNRQINNLNLKSSFNSGRKKDLSEAIINVDTLYADLQTGQMNLSGAVSNFNKPAYDINLFLNADLTGLDEVIKLGNVDSLKGKIVLKDRIKGVYDVSEKRLNNEINISELSFENFGFIIPGTIRFDRVDGTISRNGDIYSLQELNIKSEGTDFNINGEIVNIQYLIFDIEKEITAKLAIKSSVFDLPNFLEFDPSIKRDFPYRILNLDLYVDAQSTTTKLLQFKSFPQINFNIKKLDATVENFLPPLAINSGKFNISESALGFHLDFDDFKTDFLEGKFNFSGAYNTSSFQPFYIKSDIWMNGIEISKLFFDEKTDTIPSFFKSKLYGSFFLELQFATDSTEIRLFSIKNGDINYYFGEDTIQTESLSFNSENIDYDLNRNDNPLATLYSHGYLKANLIKTDYFITKDIGFNFASQNGEYDIETKSVKLFGDNSIGEGKYHLKPFKEKPSYRIQYNISRFSIKEMLNTFLEDTVVQGNMALSMDVSMNGDDWDDMIRTMDGSINLSGKNLIMYGVDADKVIKEFQRSQNFNLVDVGAVLLAGPVGLAVTKGSDYARLLITNPGESSQIIHLVSNWKAENGLLTLEDVAFATNKNRLAAKGWLNAVTDSLKISFAILNNNGCSIFTQDVFGDLNKPTLGKVKVVGALLAPVTNLYNSIVGNDCVVFYNGSVKPALNK